jgi:hypothetical protein
MLIAPEYFSGLRKMNNNRWDIPALATQISDASEAEERDIATGRALIREAVARLETGLESAGFKVVHDMSAKSALTLALTYMNPYGARWAGYNTSATIKTREGVDLLSKSTGSVPGSVQGAEILDWLPILPIELTAALHHDPQPLIDAMWGAKPGEPSSAVHPDMRSYSMESDAALALVNYPSEKVIKTLLGISRKAIRMELHFQPALGMFLKTDHGARPIGAAEYYVFQPIEATQTNAFNSIIQILGRTREQHLAKLVLRDEQWLSEWKSGC